MGAAQVVHASEQGFPVVGLRSSRAELRMVPALGGRIISLRSARTGREWCWHQPRPDWLWANQPGDAFGMSPQAGVDECLPTVAPCRVAERDLPDHGELWSQIWQLDPEALATGVLRSTLALTTMPLRFSRAIQAEADGGFRLDYHLQNVGSEAQPYLWCLHPLLALHPGDRLELPPEVTSLRLNGGLGAPMALGDRWAYPEPHPGLRLDHCEAPGMPGGCVKAFAGPLTEGRAALVNAASGDRLALHWDPVQLPFLGVWINRGHGGFHHVGLEPGNGAPDSLADALDAWKAFGVVPPGETVSWSVVIAIS